MSGLRNHAWAISITLVAYLVFAGAGAAIGCLCCCTATHVQATCDHSNGSGAQKDETSRTAPAQPDHCFHCSCYLPGVGADYAWVVNSPASNDTYQSVVASNVYSVMRAPKILGSDLVRSCSSSFQPTPMSLRSTILII